MTQILTIPNKIPKKLLRDLRNEKYNDLILFTLAVFGSHKLTELINNQKESIDNRMDE